MSGSWESEAYNRGRWNLNTRHMRSTDPADLDDLGSACSSDDEEDGDSDYSSREPGSPKRSEGGENEEDEAEEERRTKPWDEDEPPPLDINYDALKHVATYYLPGNHGECRDVTTLTRGTYHEIRVLHFKDGWSCVGRFTRRPEHLEKSESELATIEYVRKHTSIPVPQTYFANFNTNHAVGAAFVLMEYIPGDHLYRTWAKLGVEHKKSVIEQIAGVLAELSQLTFDHIGSLRADSSIGPLLLEESEDAAGSRSGSTEEYMLANMPAEANCTQVMNKINQQLKCELIGVLEANKNHAALNAPYRLFHADFDAQNMLFTHDDIKQAPQLTGIIDWDYSRTCLLYELFEYPIFIQDIHWGEHLYTENKILRKHFVRSLTDRFEKGFRQRQLVKECFRMKHWCLQNFETMWVAEDDEMDIQLTKIVLCKLKEGTAPAYEGRIDWEPDSELESDDDF